MTLLDFIAPLKTKDIKVTLTDSDDNELIRFYSDGYASVESDVLARPISKWNITSNSAVTIVLKDAESTPSSDSTSTSESESESESESQSESQNEP